MGLAWFRLEYSGFLIFVVMAAIAIMAIYALVLVSVFLRHRIKVLKAAQNTDEAGQPK